MRARCPRAAADPPHPLPQAAYSGFVALIAGAYYGRRQVWFDLDRLALELAAASDRLLPPADVAELARVVYAALDALAAPRRAEGEGGGAWGR